MVDSGAGVSYAMMSMPSTLRLLRNLVLIAALVFAGVWALATFVQPSYRELSVPVPVELGK